MAAALGVTRDSLLRLEATGVVPPATYFAPGRWPGRGRARLYPCDQVIHAGRWIDAADLRHRRWSYQRDRVRQELQRISDQAHAGIAAPLLTAGSRAG